MLEPTNPDNPTQAPKFTMLNADQLLARLYALRKDYADDTQDEMYQALHHAFLFISYNHNAFKDYVKKEADKADAD